MIIAIFAVIVVVAIGLGLYFSLHGAFKKASKAMPTPTASSESSGSATGATHSANIVVVGGYSSVNVAQKEIQNAITVKQYYLLGPHLADEVTVRSAGSVGKETKIGAVKKLEFLNDISGPWVFSVQGSQITGAAKDNHKIIFILDGKRRIQSIVI